MEREDVFLSEMGGRVNKKRKELRLSQEYLAEMADVSKQTISLIERGRQEAGAKNIAKLAKALDVSADWLLTGKRTDGDLHILNRRMKYLSASQYGFLEDIVTKFADFCEKE
jgi:transcriptional regulator with XRE-family HTH domain